MGLKKLACLSVLTVLMTSCGSGGGGGSGTSFTIGGTVTGLSGTLVLQNNRTENLTVKEDGSFEFIEKINNGRSYNVTVFTQPNSPVQTCTITNSKGTVGGAIVSNISISCIPGTAYTLSGSISGLVGSGLVLQNNGTDNRTIIASDGANVDFTFPAPVLDGSAYLVTVATQPSSPAQTCTVTNASGTVNASNVIDITLTCVTNGFTVGGEVFGLSVSTSMELKNNGSDPLTINSNGSFIFSTPILDFGAYRVAVSVQASDGKSCSVSNKNGTINGANITNISITCAQGILSVGGTVSGIAGTALVLQNNGGDDEPISSDGSFTFNTLLVAGAEYEVTVLSPSGSPNVGCSVGNGNGTITNTVTNVVVSCLQYRTVQSLESASDSAGNPTLVYDASGNVTAVWDQKGNSDSNSNAYANRYDAGSKTWGTATNIGNEDLGSVAADRKVVVDSSGNVTVIWWQSNGTRKNLWANRFTVGSPGSWGSAEIILDGTNLLNMTGTLPVPSVLVDGSGNVTVVWSQEDTSDWNQWANRFTVGTGWGTATKIEAGSGSVSDPISVIDGSGNIISIWGQKDGSRWDQWANRYTGSWGTAKRIETENLGDVTAARVAVDSSGNVTAVWTQSDGTWKNQWANRFSAGTGSWGSAQPIETQNLGDALDATLKAANNGNVMAVWTQKADGRFSQWANIYTIGAGWGTAEIIEGVDFGGDSGDAFDPSLGVDAFNNFTAVWAQNVDTTPLRKNLWANRFVGGTWVGAEKIETVDTGDITDSIRPVLVDANGNVTTVWTQHNGSINNLLANRYNIASGNWEGANPIESEGTSVQVASFSTVIDTTGNVTVVWFHRNSAGTGFERWVNRYVVSIGWGTPQRIDGSVDDFSNSAANIGDVVVDAFGKVTAAWSQSDGSSSDLKSTRID